MLPFTLIGEAGPYAAIADALPHELIAELSRLRWLFVTARGSSFRLRAANADMGEVGRLLGVRYCLSGTVEVAGSSLAVTVELVDTRDGGVVWADRFAGAIDAVHPIRTEIRSRILAALEIQIPMHEANLARLTVTENLDAWSAYHLGLQHMYRFNRKDNAAAAALFSHAVARDPRFARAHAGLSFVHFQTAFLRNTDDLATEIALARRHAERGVDLDPLDPFVNFTMGRTFWLEGDLDGSLGWLERSTSISPNYAQGIYARGWTETLAGRGLDGRRHVDLAMQLSPLDPLYYAMLGTRAFAAHDAGRGCRGRAVGRTGGPLTGCPRADRDDRHGRAGDGGRRGSRGGVGRQRADAQCRIDPRRLLPLVSDEIRGSPGARVECPRAIRILRTTRTAALAPVIELQHGRDPGHHDSPPRVSTIALRLARPAAKSVPTILSISKNRPITLARYGCWPCIAHVTSVVVASRHEREFDDVVRGERLEHLQSHRHLGGRRAVGDRHAPAADVLVAGELERSAWATSGTGVAYPSSQGLSCSRATTARRCGDHRSAGRSFRAAR